MNAEDLIRTIKDIGGTLAVERGSLIVELPKGQMTPDLRKALIDRKAGLIDVLSRKGTRYDDSIRRFQHYRVALRIESDACGTVWLISDESVLPLVDTDDPIYTGEQARFLIDLEPDHALFLHRFRRTFGGTVEFRH